MSGQRSPYVVVLSAAVRTRLKKLARTAVAPYRQVVRARILLDAAAGRSNAATARTHGVHVDTVRRCRRRFRAEGQAALIDPPRPGRPRRYGPAAPACPVPKLGRSAGLRFPTSSSGSGILTDPTADGASSLYSSCEIDRLRRIVSGWS